MPDSRIHVSFESDSDPYTILEGDLADRGQGGGMCLEKCRGAARIQVDLPVPSTVTLLSFALQTVNAAIFRDIFLYDVAWNQIHHWQDIFSGNWTTLTETVTVGGVAHTVFQGAASNPPVGPDPWARMDNCIIDFQPSAGPVAAFDYEPDDDTLTVQFLDRSHDGNPGAADPSLFLTRYIWDFGDGHTHTDTYPDHPYEAPAHTYDEPGDYTVTLTVRQLGGLEDSTQAAVRIGDPVSKVTPRPIPLHSGMAECPFCHFSQDVYTRYPLELRDGEKYEQSTDLSLITPAGPLSLTRSYRQGKQGDAHYQLLGLGWTHNHRMSLTEDTGVTPNTILVRMPGGGAVHFVETAADRFEATAGSTALIDWDGANSRYVMTTADRSTFTFDSAGNLLSRAWPNGETWTYTYSGGRLSRVDDGYGRQLQFVYYDTADYRNGQLWRVGDHTAAGLDGDTPTGRYVEYDYTPEMIGGAPIATPRALLASVRDARGQTWTYDCYGQHAGEMDTTRLNLLTREVSPSVDTTGDGMADGSLTRKRLTYHFQVEIAANGGMETEGDWTGIAGAEPSVNARAQAPAPVDAGTYSRHVSAAAAGQGVEGNVWKLVAGRTYTITARVYPVSGAVQMHASGTGAFDDASTGSGAWETLTAIYQPGASSENHRLQFTASGGAAEFYLDSVSIVEVRSGLASVVAEQGIQGAGSPLAETTFVFQAGQDKTVTHETAAGRTRIHRFSPDVDGMDERLRLRQRGPGQPDRPEWSVPTSEWW